MTPQYFPAEIPPFFLLEKIDLVKQFGRAEDTRQDVPVEDRMFSQRLLLNSGEPYFLLNVSTHFSCFYNIVLNHCLPFISGYLDNPMYVYVSLVAKALGWCHCGNKYELFSRWCLRSLKSYPHGISPLILEMRERLKRVMNKSRATRGNSIEKQSLHKFIWGIPWRYNLFVTQM